MMLPKVSKSWAVTESWPLPGFWRAGWKQKLDALPIIIRIRADAEKTVRAFRNPGNVRFEAGPGKAYSYIYTVSKPLTEEEKRAARENTTRRALEAPDMQATFEAGVTVWYRYYDTSGTKVLEFAVKKGD